MSFYHFSELTEDESFGTFKSKVAELTKIEISQLEIRLGFPPKVLATADNISLKDAGIAHGGKYLITNFPAGSLF